MTDEEYEKDSKICELESEIERLQYLLEQAVNEAKQSEGENEK